MYFCVCSGHLCSKVLWNWRLQQTVKEGLYTCQKFSIRAKLSSFKDFFRKWTTRSHTLITQLSLWALFQVECKIQCKLVAWFLNSFFCNSNNIRLTCTISLPRVKTTLFIVWRSFWCWTIQKIYLFPRTSMLYVYHSPMVFFPHLKIQTVGWQVSAARL